MPIYFVVGAYIPDSSGYMVIRILKVFETTLENIRDKNWYEAHVGPFYGSGQNVTTATFYREPDNPFREFKEVK